MPASSISAGRRGSVPWPFMRPWPAKAGFRAESCLAPWAAYGRPRLVLYILKDRILAEKEDSRYQRLRAHWGDKANQWFFFFFTSQSLLVVLVRPALSSRSNKPEPSLSIFDALARRHLAVVHGWRVAGRSISWLGSATIPPTPEKFAARDSGTGHATRTISSNGSIGSPMSCSRWGPLVSALTLIGPVAMYLFLMKLTGIPHVERESLAKRGEAYREYQETTQHSDSLAEKKESRVRISTGVRTPATEIKYV